MLNQSSPHSFIRHLLPILILGVGTSFFVSCGKFQPLKGKVFLDEALFSKRMCDNPGGTPPPGTPPGTPPPPGTTPPKESKAGSSDPDDCETIEIRYDCSDRVTSEVGSNLIKQENDGVAITIYQVDDNGRLTTANHLADPTFKKNIWNQIVNTKEMTFNLRNLGQMLGKAGQYAIQFRAEGVAGSSPADDFDQLTTSHKGNLGSLENAVQLHVDDSGQAHLATGITELIYASRTDIGDDVEEECDRTHSPLMVNFDGGPITLSPPTSGAHFDMDGDGHLDRISWPTHSRIMFLVHDRNQNGGIDSVHELFGDNTRFPDGRTYSNGFEALRTFDSNSDQRIDRQDAHFSALAFWSPVANKIYHLSDLGVTSIDLAYVQMIERDEFKNETKQRSLLTIDGTHQLKIFDVYFRIIPKH